MECWKIRDELSSYIDGELSEADAIQIEAHLESCEDCREELTALRTLIASANDCCEYETPVGLRQAITAVVAELDSEHNEEIEVLVSAFVDGELSGDDITRVTRHLAVCSECRERQTDLNTLTTSLQQIDFVEPPSSLRNSIAAATSVKKDEHTHTPAKDWLRHVAGSGTAKLVTGAVTAGVIAVVIAAGPHQLKRPSETSLVKQNVSTPVASKLPSAEHNNKVAETVSKEKNDPLYVSAAKKAGKARSEIAGEPSHRVEVADAGSKHLTHNAKQTVSIEPIKLKARPDTENTAAKKNSTPVPDPVDVAVVDEDTTAEVESVESAEPETADVAKATSEEQENVKQWLQEAKVRAATKKRGKNQGITLLSKEF